MHRSLPNARGSRTTTRRLAYASVLTGLALAGVVGLGMPHPAVHAQRSDATVQTPMGRAPLSFADIVERVKPAVVSIHVTNGGAKTAQGPQGPKGGTPKSPRDFLPDLPDDHPLNEFFKNLPKEWRGQPSPSPRPSLAQGSGFVISTDGYVVTNNHVIDSASKIQVSFDKDNKYEAELIGTDQRTDIALLKIKDTSRPFTFVKFSDKTPRIGDWVLAIGNPFGLGGSVTAGIVSAQGRDIGSGPYDYMQIDAAVNRGNSGGPTFNLEGEVVGVNTAIYSPSGGNVGIAFAIPSKTASEVVEQLKSGGSVNRGWLGVKIQNVDEDTAASLGLNEPKGALVSDVTAGGPAAAAGLTPARQDTYRALIDTMAAEPGLRIDPSVADAAAADFVARYATWPPDAQRRADDLLDALAQSTARPFSALDRSARAAHLRSCGRPTDDDPVGPERRRLDLAQGAMSLAAVTLGPSGGELDRPLDSV